jgi:hypothetical protein
LCSDFLVQAVSQRVEGAMQPLVKFHQWFDLTTQPVGDRL